MVDGRDDSVPAESHEGGPEPGPEEGAVELQDASLAEPPPPAPEPRDGFDPVDGAPLPEAAPEGVPPPAVEAPPGEETSAVERDTNYLAFQQRARLAEDRLAEVLSGYRQLKKETEEHKVRVSRNTERRFEQRHERLMLKFIDILDNLDRALDAAEGSFAGEALIQGLILVRTQLVQTLKDEGLERIPVLGLAYDPHVSEAIGTEPVADQEKDQLVLKELLRGYRLNGRVARAGRVVIGEWKPEATAPAAETTAPDAGSDAPPAAEDGADGAKDPGDPGQS